MRTLTILVLAMLILTGCPRDGAGPGVRNAPEEEHLDVHVALLEVAQREASRDAASEVVPLLRHPDVGVRCAAVRALGRMGRPEALEPIAWRLYDDAPEVREAAAFALSLSHAWSVDEATERLLVEDRVGEALITALEQEEDLLVRCAIARALGAGAGKDSWSTLEELVLGGEAKERVAALEGMAMLGRRGIASPITGELLDPLLPALVVVDPEIRWWSAYLLVRCELAEDEGVRQRAHEALVMVAGSSEDTAVLAVTARAIAMVGHEDAAAALGRMLEVQPSTDVRVAIARALGGLLRKDEPVRMAAERLCTMVADPEPTVREMAVAGLGLAAAWPDEVVDAVVPLLTDADGPVRASAAAAVGTLELADAVALLEIVEEDPEPFVRANRAAVLVGLEGEQAAAEVDELLAGEGIHPLVRMTALEVLGASDPPRARSHLLAALSGESAPEAVIAAGALKAQWDDQVRATMLEAYDRWPGFEGSEVRLYVLEALVEMGDVPQGWVDAALEDDDEFVRLAAARAIRATGRNVVARRAAAPELADGMHGVADVTGARIETDRGMVEVALFPDMAAGTVASFVQLAEQGFYDSLTFHRVIPSFVAQGGDPDGTGWGGPGYRLRSEFNPVSYEPGTLGMARGPMPDSEGSQWFITHDRQPHLTGHYTVFGRVTEGMDVVNAIRQGDRIVGVEIVRSTPAPAPTDP